MWSNETIHAKKRDKSWNKNVKINDFIISQKHFQFKPFLTQKRWNNLYHTRFDFLVHHVKRLNINVTHGGLVTHEAAYQDFLLFFQVNYVKIILISSSRTILRDNHNKKRRDRKLPHCDLKWIYRNEKWKSRLFIIISVSYQKKA